MITARFITRGPLAGPAFLDLLTALAAGDRELGALHSAADGRWSVLGVDPALSIEFSAQGVGRWITHGGRVAPAGPPRGTLLETFDAMLATVELVAADAGETDREQRSCDGAATPGKPGAIGAGAKSAPAGWLGWIGYDIGRHLEEVGDGGVDDMGWPLLRWTLFESYYVLDHQRQEWLLVAAPWDGDDAASAGRRLDAMARTLAGVAPARPLTAAVPGVITQQIAPAEYGREVLRVIDYIGAGDVYQVNLAQRWTIETSETPLDTFRRLCAASAAPFAAYFQFGSRAIVSASPELFLQRDAAAVETRPIKGTRPRRPDDPLADAGQRAELEQSPKDRAELAMIVDLLRNDLGRVCRFGTVRVIEPRQVERHPTVWHTVATIRGQLKAADMGWGNILAALCPGGSITGAPKIRAMQIIHELEAFRRGVYCGNIGWLGPAGTGALNIAIRTLLMERQTEPQSPNWRAWLWAGGGVVADSRPQAEYDETLHKARALGVALGVALPARQQPPNISSP